MYALLFLQIEAGGFRKSLEDIVLLQNMAVEIAPLGNDGRGILAHAGHWHNEKEHRKHTC